MSFTAFISTSNFLSKSMDVLARVFEERPTCRRDRVAVSTLKAAVAKVDGLSKLDEVYLHKPGAVISRALVVAGLDYGAGIRRLS